MRRIDEETYEAMTSGDVNRAVEASKQSVTGRIVIDAGLIVFQGSDGNVAISGIQDITMTDRGGWPYLRVVDEVGTVTYLEDFGHWRRNKQALVLADLLSAIRAVLAAPSSGTAGPPPPRPHLDVPPEIGEEAQSILKRIALAVKEGP